MTSWLEWLLNCGERDQRDEISTAQSGVEKTLQIMP